MVMKSENHRPDRSVGGMLSGTDDGSSSLHCKHQERARLGSGPKPVTREQRAEVDHWDMREVLNNFNTDMKREAKELNVEIMQLVKNLGGSSTKYQRERKKGLQAIVSEIYSPPRVTAAVKLLPEMNCVPGFALDLTTVDEQGRPWNL